MHWFINFNLFSLYHFPTVNSLQFSVSTVRKLKGNLYLLDILFRMKIPLTKLLVMLQEIFRHFVYVKGLLYLNYEFYPSCHTKFLFGASLIIDFVILVFSFSLYQICLFYLLNYVVYPCKIP